MPSKSPTLAIELGTDQPEMKAAKWGAVSTGRSKEEDGGEASYVAQVWSINFRMGNGEKGEDYTGIVDAMVDARV